MNIKATVMQIKNLWKINQRDLPESRMFYLSGSSTSTYVVIQALLLMVVFRFETLIRAILKIRLIMTIFLPYMNLYSKKS